MRHLIILIYTQCAKCVILVPSPYDIPESVIIWREWAVGTHTPNTRSLLTINTSFLWPMSNKLDVLNRPDCALWFLLFKFIDRNLHTFSPTRKNFFNYCTIDVLVESIVILYTSCECEREGALHEPTRASETWHRKIQR